MLKKIALTAASLTAALTIAGGLALAGFGAPSPVADMQVVDQVISVADATAPTDPSGPVQVDTIYLAPQPTPEEITVTQVKEATHRDDDEDEGHEGDDGHEGHEGDDGHDGDDD